MNISINLDGKTVYSKTTRGDAENVVEDLLLVYKACVEKIKVIHKPYEGTCQECLDPYPCTTVQAIESRLW